MKTRPVQTVALPFLSRVLIITAMSTGICSLYAALKEAGAAHCEWAAMHPKDVPTLPVDGQYTLIIIQEGRGGCDAFSLLPDLRAKYPSIPILVVTPYTDSARLDRLMQLGAFSAVAAKHVRSGALSSTLRWILQERLPAETASEESPGPDALQTNVPMILWGTDREGIITYVEGKGVDEIGAASLSLIGKSAFDMLKDYSSSLAMLRRVLGGAYSGRIAEVIEFARRRALVDTHCVSLRNDDGQIRGAAGVSMVMTEYGKAGPAVKESAARVYAAEALTESARRFEAVYRSLPVPTYTWKQVENDFLLVDFNEAAIRNSPDRLNGMLNAVASDFFRKNPQVVALLRRCQDQKTTLQTELDYSMRITGEQRHFLVHGVALPPDLVILHTVDVTERKRNEQIMREANARLEKVVALRTSALREQAALLDLANDAIIVRTLDGRITFWNHGAEILYGWSCNEATGKTTQELLQTRYPIPTADIIYRTLREGNLEIEIEQVARDGRQIIVASRWAPQRDDIGNPIGFLEINRDITDRKRAEEDLRKSKEEYRLLIENQTDMVMKVSRDGIRLYASPNFLQLVGKTEEEVVNTSFLSDVHPDDADRVLREWQATFEPPHYRSDIETRMMTGSGWRWLSWRNQAIPGKEGEPTTAIKVGRDITELKEAEEALRQSEARFRSIFERATFGIILVDADFQIADVNPAFQQILGYSLEDMRRLGLPGITHPDDLAHANQLFEDLIYGKIDHYHLDKRYFRKDGSIMYGSLTVFASRDERGKLLHTTGMVEDITARKESEQRTERYSEELEQLVMERTAQIRQLERLRSESEKQAAVGRMAARIAHEINNPLAGVKNSFLLVKQAVSREHKHFRFVEMIEKELDRIARIVRQMFELYKPEIIKPGQVQPAQVIREVTELLEGNVRAQGVTMEIDTRRAAQAVLLHEDSLRQILFSVIQNAIEASPSGGVVRIAANYDGRQLTVSVTDQGSGIPEDVKSRIFDPFFTTKSELASGGLGLGLSITKGIVEAMGGSLTFESEIDKGTTFFIGLPAKSGPENDTA
ncbi:MAG TPA: PAS domain S-box protein [bacterium]|jgi:hypothetical protein